MIKLLDLIQLAGIRLESFIFHCATGKNPSPLEVFFDGTFRQWQEFQRQKNFQCDYILSLIHLDSDRWLFAGIYKVNGMEASKQDNRLCYIYSTCEITGLDHLIGKAIIRFNKKFRASYLHGEKYIDQLLLSELRDNRMTIGDFPGYNAVVLSYRMLKTVIRELNPSWRTALSNVSGIYLITDTSDG